MKVRLISAGCSLFLASCNSFYQVTIHGSVNIGNHGPKSAELIVLGIKPRQEKPVEVKTVTKEKVVYRDRVPNGYCPEFPKVTFLPMVELPIVALADAKSTEESRAIILDTIERLRAMSWGNRDIYDKAYAQYRKACSSK